jgi:cytochrome P450
LDSLVNA